MRATHKTTMYLVSPLEVEVAELEPVAAAAAATTLAEEGTTTELAEVVVGITAVDEEASVEVSSPA